MSLHQLVDRFGPAIVFLNVMGSALGLPVPAMPTMIIVGASIALTAVNGGAFWPPLAGVLCVAVAGGVIGDLVWFQGGRKYGDKTLKTICKLSLSRDTCVKKTERFFGRWGVRVLLVAKFIPGLSLVSVPLAGAMGVKLRSFIAHDGAGVALWSIVGLTVGVIFAAQLEMVFALIAQLGRQAVMVVAVLLAVYVAYRWWRRRALMATLEKARISVDELYALMNDQPLPVIFDIRSPEKRMLDPAAIPGSLFADERELATIIENYDKSRKVVVYCSCPNEVSAAWMAKTMRNAGFRDVVPLTGGLDAWRLAGFEVATLTEFGELVATTPEEVAEMAAMCPWSVKSAAPPAVPPASATSLHEAGLPHGDRA
ncbi:DedA family protein/thiosulfate sulfurtransferase GlpE [Caballeronia sp. LZ065]|uniref:DedA family protein/thiosulfate sulfurtransferase GlpE n=1 Tax=Caballeronia sp. LZ065 TaxID=3038571 RepID=UPI0028560100|nr:DedA family protein/thiosulfate sulfurtransferase GlpE [Caballeronia sp. LZ065]MDR5784196.1 DedA family protein/thiosulfate sulfurtransferase GlpE [Caballeronia sp. LZ065]